MHPDFLIQGQISRKRGSGEGEWEGENKDRREKLYQMQSLTLEKKGWAFSQHRNENDCSTEESLVIWLNIYKD